MSPSSLPATALLRNPNSVSIVQATCPETKFGDAQTRVSESELGRWTLERRYATNLGKP
ncbi:MAG: hypothetical protein QW795_08985 [Candidatus Bathyarchaeia archaeon]